MLDLLFAVLGCCFSFGLGAYVRQPFSFAKKKPASTPEEQAYKDKIAKEWASLMAYDGKEQYDED